MSDAYVDMEIQSHKLKAAGYSQKAIEDANFEILKKMESTFTPVEKQVFYEAVNKAFPSYRRTTSDPDLTFDEKRFFWATLNVEGVVIAPQSEIEWAVLWLADKKFSDAEFEALQRRIRLYKKAIIENPAKASPPSWAVGKY